uniref:Sulfotransferase n=1 Tax=Chelonoidis abingdonii TaxID=106734 RepID=A0A8C0GJD9_CHEAB
MEPSKEFLYKHKGFYLLPDLTNPEYIDSLEHFVVRDSDVFVVTFPKSGTVWMQNILSLIYYEGLRDGTAKTETIDRVPWLEYNFNKMNYESRPSPRLFSSHLPLFFILQVIYVARNPKDVAVSYFHFSKHASIFEKVPDFNILMERFLSGKVLASSWFDHVKGWYTHRADYNILFLTYEEMKKDLRSAVLKVCDFLGKQLTEKELDVVVEKAVFDNMKSDPRSNYEDKTCILEKDIRNGTVGDWKNIMTVAQNEKFNKVFNENMKDLPFKFIWDLNEEI